MILTVTDIQPGDVRHLYCTDPRFKEELARARRRSNQPVSPTAREPFARPAEQVPTQTPRTAA